MINIKNIAISLLVFLVLAILMYFGFQSDFAKANNKANASEIYKFKSKNAKKLYYNTDFKVNRKNSNLISLGDFTVNTNGRMLTMKVTVESDEDTIESFMRNQSVVRDDVINSVYSIKGRKINQDNVQNAVRDTLNARFSSKHIKDVYFETFIIQ